MEIVLGIFGLLVGGGLVCYLVTEGSDRPLYTQVGLLLGYMVIFTALVTQCSG